MVEWAERFDAQMFLHTADLECVMRKSPRIRFWEETTLSLWDGLTLINCGGHFEGGSGRLRSNVFSKGSNHSHSNKFTARGGKRRFSQMQKDAKAAVRRSTERYLHAISF